MGKDKMILVNKWVVAVWDFIKNKNVVQYNIIADSNVCVAALSANQFIVSKCEGKKNYILIVTLEKDQSIKKDEVMNSNEPPITVLTVSQDAKYMAVGYENGMVRIYAIDIQNPKDWSYQESKGKGNSPILDLAFTGTRELVIISDTSVTLHSFPELLPAETESTEPENTAPHPL